MKVYIIIEEKNGVVVWTDTKTYADKEEANYAASFYNKFYKKGAKLRVITLDMTKIKPSKVA